MVFSQQMVVKREEMHASVYAWARSGVARRYWGVAGQITLSFRLFSPSPHNFRWWYRPRPRKCRQSHVHRFSPSTPPHSLLYHIYPTPSHIASSHSWIPAFDATTLLSSRLLHCSWTTNFGYGIQRQELYLYIPHHKEYPYIKIFELWRFWYFYTICYKFTTSLAWSQVQTDQSDSILIIPRMTRTNKFNTVTLQLSDVS